MLFTYISAVGSALLKLLVELELELHGLEGGGGLDGPGSALLADLERN